MVDDWEGCKAFLQEVGYPVIVKPDTGVGASNTEKLTCDEELAAFFAAKPDVPFIMEEFVPGHIETFDGITDRDGNLLREDFALSEEADFDEYRNQLYVALAEKAAAYG